MSVSEDHQLLVAALQYAEHGWAVFPLRGKLPAIPKRLGGNGCKDATLELDRVRLLWTERPEANIGVATGAPSGTWVLDIDGNQGESSLTELERQYDSLPITVEQITGGGGRHLFFAYTAEAIPNRAGHLAPGIDVRATGGYVVVPPSRHPETRHRYQWREGRSPFSIPLAVAPAWLISLVTQGAGQPTANRPAARNQNHRLIEANASAAHRYAEAALANECAAVAAAAPGQQETTLNAAALKIGSLVAAGALPQARAKASLLAAGVRMHAEPGKRPWIAADVGEKIARAFDAAAPRSLPPTVVSKFAAAGSVVPQPDWILANGEGTWAPPLDVFGDTRLAGTPELPVGLLPDAIERFARDSAARIGVDSAMVALPALVVTAAVLDDRWRLQPKQHDTAWSESARLWIGVIGEPGTKKTPAISASVAPLREIETEWAADDIDALERYALEQRVYHKSVENYAGRRAKGEPATAPSKPSKPAERRRLVGDITIEALADVLADNPAGVLALHDELTGWIASFDAYRDKGGGSKDRADWLELYNGGPHPVDRVKRGRVVVPNWSASLLGGIQPEPMKRLSAKLQDDGLVQRFIVVYARRTGAGEDRPPDEHAVGGYRSMLRALIDIGAPPAGQPPIRLSAAAHEARCVVSRVAGSVGVLPDTSPAFRAHLDKWEGLFARLLLVCHAADAAGRGNPLELEVAGDIAERVARFMIDFLLPHAARFYADTLGKRVEATRARWVAGHLLAHGLERISERDLYRAYSELRGDRKRIEETMQVLEMTGWVMPADGTRFPSRPTTKWIVNPLVHKHFAERAARECARREEEKRRIREAVAALGMAPKSAESAE